MTDECKASIGASPPTNSMNSQPTLEQPSETVGSLGTSISPRSAQKQVDYMLKDMQSLRAKCDKILQATSSEGVMSPKEKAPTNKRKSTVPKKRPAQGKPVPRAKNQKKQEPVADRISLNSKKQLTRAPRKRSSMQNISELWPSILNLQEGISTLLERPASGRTFQNSPQDPAGKWICPLCWTEHPMPEPLFGDGNQLETPENPILRSTTNRRKRLLLPEENTPTSTMRIMDKRQYSSTGLAKEWNNSPTASSNSSRTDTSLSPSMKVHLSDFHHHTLSSSQTSSLSLEL